jgi:hypothetical protein
MEVFLVIELGYIGNLNIFGFSEECVTCLSFIVKISSRLGSDVEGDPVPLKTPYFFQTTNSSASTPVIFDRKSFMQDKIIGVDAEPCVV